VKSHRQEQRRIIAARRAAEPEWFTRFVKNWIATLWNAMATTGRGYRRPSMRHTGKGTDRRLDKLPSDVRERVLENMKIESAHDAVAQMQSRAERRMSAGRAVGRI